MSEKPRLLLSMPCYSRRPDLAASRAFHTAYSDHVEIKRKVYVASLLAHGFNLCWIEALENDYDYFVMLHADVEPQDNFIDMMLTQMWKHSADMLGAVIPLKTPHGLTSTAIGNPKSTWRPVRRITMKELTNLPVTFCAKDAGYPGHPLLLNTGLLLVDLTRPYLGDVDGDGALRVYFTINDRVLKGKTKLNLQVESEDWFFSRRAWECGAVLYATKAVTIKHHGDAYYGNFGDWGKWDYDKRALDGPKTVDHDD